jgi:carboxyl-terminal processing protease
MRLTTARYYTPSGRSIQQSGIEPDILVNPAKVEEVAMGPGIREADLRGALENDTEKTAKASKKAKASDDSENGDDEAVQNSDKDGKKKGDKKPVDYQMERALDLIHGLHLFEIKASAAAPAVAAAGGSKK